MSEAETLLGEKHFANKRFFTDGSGIYLQLQGSLRNQKAESLLRLLSGGQWVIPEIILQTSEQIDFDTVSEHAIRWYPVPGDRRIVLDPRISFGAPIIASHGIKTINIYDLYLAENNNINAVSDWMEIEKDEILSAIEFEMKLAA